MKCFKCKQKINSKDHYFEFREMLEGKLVGTVYAHKHCWDEVKSTLNLTTGLSGIMNQISGMLPKKKEEYVIP